MHMKNYINQNAISFASHEKIEELSQKSKGSPLKELTGLAWLDINEIEII